MGPDDFWGLWNESARLTDYSPHSIQYCTSSENVPSPRTELFSRHSSAGLSWYFTMNALARTLALTDHFSRRADIFGSTTVELTTEDSAHIA